MKVRAYVSFYNEHGVFAKNEVLERLEVKDSEVVGITLPSKGMSTMESIFSFSELDLKQESKMLISLFDALANQHYYFLTEFGFTEMVSWTPKQYDYLSEVHPAFDINKRKKDYRTFKELYTLVEELLVSFLMSLRSKGVDPNEFYNNEEFIEIIEDASVFLEKMLRVAYEKVDVVIGCGTFFSLSDLPIDIAFQVSGLDVGQLSYTEPQRIITVNPFLFYWLISSFFKYNKNKTPPFDPAFISIEILQKPDVQTANIRELRIRTYSPSKIVAKTFIGSVDSGIEHVKDYLKKNVFVHKPFIFPGDILTPFSCPSIVLEADLEESEEIPIFVDSTPYGQVIYEMFALPKITENTQIIIELFSNPLFNKDVPLILDTNVIDIGAFPYDVNSPFFKAFIIGREVVIPSIVIYELMRKIEVGIEKQKVIRALVRLLELKSKGSIKLKISDELLPFEAATHELLTQLGVTEEIKKHKSVRSIRSDIRDSLIIQEALRRNAVLFTNDKKLRTLATLLGVPTISYNSLIDDVRSVVKSVCQSKKKVDKREIIKLVKDYAFEVRGEKYRDEDVSLALGYLRQLDREINNCLS